MTADEAIKAVSSMSYTSSSAVSQEPVTYERLQALIRELDSPPIIPRFHAVPVWLQLKTVQARTHKRRRTNLKWRKRFGYTKRLDPKLANAVTVLKHDAYADYYCGAKAVEAIKKHFGAFPPPGTEGVPRAVYETSARPWRLSYGGPAT